MTSLRKLPDDQRLQMLKNGLRGLIVQAERGNRQAIECGNADLALAYQGFAEDVRLVLEDSYPELEEAYKGDADDGTLRP